MKKLIFKGLILIFFVSVLFWFNHINLVSNFFKFYNEDDINTLHTDFFDTNEYLDIDFNNEDVCFDIISSNYVISYDVFIATMIISIKDHYRYMVFVDWIKIPEVRGSDVVAIGVTDDVVIRSNISFNLNYSVGSNTYNLQSAYLQKSLTGASAVFKLPTSDDVTNISCYLYFMLKSDLIIYRFH